MKSRAVFLLAIGLLFGRVAFGATELIGNGGFESSSNAPWLFVGDLTSVPVIDIPSQAHTGNGYLSLGNVNGVTNQGVYQWVAIPTNTTLALYTYFFDSTVVQPGDLASSVQFSALVVQSNGNSTILDQQFNPSSSYGWNQRIYDLTAFAGKTVQIGFLVQQLGFGTGIRTSFGVDDVSLISFTTNDIPANDDFTNAASLGMTTNVSVSATNILATKEPGEPKITGNPPSHSVWWVWTSPTNGVVTITTDNSTFDTVLGLYTGTALANLSLVAQNDDDGGSRGGVTSQVKTAVSAGTQYYIDVDGKSGATGVIELSLAFAPDTKAPTLKISSPKSGSKVTNDTVVVKGTAADNVAIGAVEYRLENSLGTNDYQNADGTNSWTATVTGLAPGPNTIRVIALDTSGNPSKAAAVSVTYTVVSPIVVQISGTGTVSPNLNGQLLQVGNKFTITAKPGAGQVFSSWSGDIAATTAALTFTMQSNLFLQANFVPNPFTPVTGLYEGLFYDTNNPAHASSGYFSGTLASAGSFSAKLILGGASYSLSGQFSAGGSFSNSIARKGLPPVSVQMHLDMTGDSGITGELSDGVWTAELNANRPATGNVPEAGHYTLLIPGGLDGVALPGGDSYGTVAVSTTGGITFAGVLADGTKVSQKVNVLANGQWPFYIPLYKGAGSILGWLTFSNGADSDISGAVDWFKLTQSKSKLYPAGFTNSTDAVGSLYTFTAGVPVLNISNGEVWLANGNVAQSFTNQITLDSASKVTNQSSNALSITITTSTGLFKGSVVNPATGKAISVNGVILQKQNFGGGFFTGATQTGRVFLGP